MAPHSSTLAWKLHGQRSLVGCSPRGLKESDMTERLPFHFLLSCIGEGNGNPLQCSCLENPRDGGIWWASVYGVAQSRTRLKQLSSSSISSKTIKKNYLFGCAGLLHVGPLVMACELLVVTCGIQFPDQGSNEGALHWEYGVIATGPPRKAHTF